MDLLSNLSKKDYEKNLLNVPGLSDIVNKYYKKEKDEDKLLLMEFVLFGLSEHSLLSRYKLENGIQFKDMLSSMFTMPSSDESLEDDDPDIFNS